MIAAKVAMVDLAVELNLPLSTLDRINKVFEKSLRVQTLLKGQLKMFLFLVLSSSFLCLLFFFSVIRGRHVCLRFLSWRFQFNYFQVVLLPGFPSHVLYLLYLVFSLSLILRVLLNYLLEQVT